MTTPVPPLAGSFDSVAEAFVAACRQFGQQDAYVEDGIRLSFAEWHSRSQALARCFVGLGVEPGSVVAIYLPPCIDYAVCYGAAVLAGAVASGINVRLGSREVEAVLTRCEPALIVAEDGLVFPARTGMAVIRRSALEAAVSAAAEGTPIDVRRRADDPAMIIWTSGTTGLPKGAWFDHRNLRAAVTSAGPMTHPFDRKLSNTPFAHAGYMAKLWEQLAFGVTIVIAPTPWTAESMHRLLRDERITAAAAVPTQWEKLLRLPVLTPGSLPDLRICVTATAPATPELVERITARLGCPLIGRYAMTESPSISGTSPGDSLEVLFRSVGRPQPGTWIRITDDAGQTVSDGEPGRIRIKGPCVMRGYWREPEWSRESFDSDGWLVSSDLGYLDPAGNLVLVGRASDMYIRGGYNVYPLEVENVLAEHPSVAQVAVVGLKTPVIGEIGVAFVVPTVDHQAPSLEVLRQWTRERLADYKAPDRLELAADLPLTSMMKVDKAALHARLAVDAMGDKPPFQHPPH